DAKKVGASIWFLDRGSMMLFVREIKRAAIEQLGDTPTLVYETAGVMPDGTVVRRSCAHYIDGPRTLFSSEIAFLDPMSAREYLSKQKAGSADGPVAAPVAAVTIVEPPKPAVEKI